MSYRSVLVANGECTYQPYDASPNSLTLQKLLGGSAHDGYLRMDDKIVAINGCNVVGLRLQDALDLSRRCGEHLTLTLQRLPVDYENRRQQRRRSRQVSASREANVGVDVANTDQTNIVVRSQGGHGRSHSANPQAASGSRATSSSPSPIRHANRASYVYDNGNVYVNGNTYGYGNGYGDNGYYATARQDYNTHRYSACEPPRYNGNVSSGGSPAGKVVQRQGGSNGGGRVRSRTSVQQQQQYSNSGRQNAAQKRALSQSVVNLSSDGQVGRAEQDAISLCEYANSSKPRTAYLGPGPTRLHQIIAAEQARQEANSGAGSTFTLLANDGPSVGRVQACASQF